MTASTSHELIETWTAAERSADVHALEGMLAEDFLFVGPLGFLLDGDQWLDRFRSGQLRYTRFQLGETQARSYGGATVIVGVQQQDGDYHGRPVAGRFRLTLILDVTGVAPRIAGGPLSPITPAGPPAR